MVFGTRTGKRSVERRRTKRGERKRDGEKGEASRVGSRKKAMEGCALDHGPDHCQDNEAKARFLPLFRRGAPKRYLE